MQFHQNQCALRYQLFYFPIVSIHAFSILPGTTIDIPVHDADGTWHDLQQAAVDQGAMIHDDLHLLETSGGYRGVYFTGEKVITPGTEIFRVPLKKLCLCSDNDENWAFELAKTLHERMMVTMNEANDSSGSAVDTYWFMLFPKPHVLSPTLPVHWDEALLECTQNHALQAGVDTAYFARGSSTGTIGDDLMFSYALDLVQTRVCRIQDTTRCLAPLFDCLNHHDTRNNCSFDCDGENLIVSSLFDIRKSDELLIHYGDASTKPSWRCLLSYGFVPQCDDSDQAEVVVNSRRFVIQENEIPEDLVAMMSSGGEASFDTSSATSIADALTNYKHNELQHRMQAVECYIVQSESEVISKNLALELLRREEQIMDKCAMNLKQWAETQKDEN